MTTPDTFEARLVGYKKESRKDGDWVEVRFHIHPDDVTEAINNAPLKTRFMVAAVPVVDEADPMRPMTAEDDEMIAAHKPRPWSTLTPREQAVIRCGDGGFEIWLRTFGWTKSKETIAEAVRRICDVQSRADLDTNPEAAAKWRELDQRFMVETGRTTEERS